MKYLFITILLLPFNLAMTQVDAGAKLDKVSARLQSDKPIQLDFTFSLENKELDILDSYDGSLVMHGEKFRLNLMGMLAISDSKAMWIYMEDINEANIMDPSDSDFFNPKNIFDLYKDDFNVKYIGKENQLDKIELIPKETNDNYKLLILKTDPSSDQIKEVYYEGHDGNNYSIKVKNMLTDIQIDDRFFIFDKSKYPGVEVFDMR